MDIVDSCFTMIMECHLEAYEALLSEHKYSVNEKVWDRVDFGSVTLDN